jgi:elongation factor Ts
VKKLRASTGAGMMDCKKALAEAGGDFEAAAEVCPPAAAAPGSL